MNDPNQSLADRLDQAHYVAEPDLVTTLSLMGSLGRPLLVEGEAGVGKTAIGKVLAEIHDCPLIRLLERPLLSAIRQDTSPVLLIDEIDRTDEAFEAFLLELLSDFQISIPEIGTISARSRPMVILTSNGTRELSDALRRRCLYYFMEYPDFEKELRIIHARLPGVGNRLAMQVAGFVQKIRKLELRKQPGVAETLDWASALMGYGIEEITATEFIIQTARTCLLKTRDDLSAVSNTEVARIIEAVS